MHTDPIHYRLSGSKDTSLIFEVGGIWYIIDENQKVHKATVQDINHLLDIQAIHKATPSEDERRIINDFIINLVFHTDDVEENFDS